MFTTIIAFILILGLLVFVHELGHFWVARKMGMDVEEFGIGFPPRLFSVKRGNTVYSLNLVPLGGFVKILGENGEAKDNPSSFSAKPIWKRAAVLVAGVTMNVVLAYVVFVVGFAHGIPHVVDDTLPAGAEVRDQKVQVVQVVPESAAAQQGIQVGDVVRSIDEVVITSSDLLQQVVQERSTQQLVIEVDRMNEIKTLTVLPRAIEPDGQPVLGVAMADTAIVSYPLFSAIGAGAKATFGMLWTIVSVFGTMIAALLGGGGMAADVSGPVGIAVMTGQVVDLGFAYLLQFIAILSLNLAIINILPIPALDGGRLLFLFVEKIKGSPINQERENLIHNIGFMVLLALVAVVTYKDIIRYGGGVIVDSIKNFF